jgi:hypothetical protein
MMALLHQRLQRVQQCLCLCVHTITYDAVQALTENLQYTVVAVYLAHVKHLRSAMLNMAVMRCSTFLKVVYAVGVTDCCML